MTTLAIVVLIAAFVSIINISRQTGQDNSKRLLPKILKTVGLARQTTQEPSRSFEYVLPENLKDQQDSSFPTLYAPSPTPTEQQPPAPELPPIQALPEEGSALGLQIQSQEAPIQAVPEPGGYNPSGLNVETGVWHTIKDFFGQILNSLTNSP